MKKFIKNLFKKNDNHIKGTSLCGSKLTTDKSSGDYSPFFNGNDYISGYPLSQEEMDEKGFTSMEFSCDIETGYYAYIYKK